MVFEYNVKDIIMVTALKEDKKGKVTVKCSKYW